MIPKTSIGNKQCPAVLPVETVSSEIRALKSEAPRKCWMTEATHIPIPLGIPQIVESYLSPFHPLRMRFRSGIDPKFLEAIDDKQQTHFDTVGPA